MRKLILASVLALICATNAFADLAITAVDQEGGSKETPVQARKGRNVRLIAKTDMKIVNWDAGGADVDLIPYLEPGDPTPRALFLAPEEGLYRILAWVASGPDKSERSVLWIQVGKSKPGPTPNPLSDLAKALKEAYDREGDPQKAEVKKQIAAIYKEAAEKWVEQASSIKEIVTKIQAEHDSVFKNKQLLGNVRAAIAVELRKKLPTRTDATYDKGLCKQVFGEIATALESF